MKKTEPVFVCRKCGHQLFVTGKDVFKKLVKADCPNCGEEAYENWIFSRMGNYDKECGD